MGTQEKLRALSVSGSSSSGNTVMLEYVPGARMVRAQNEKEWC